MNYMRIAGPLLCFLLLQTINNASAQVIESTQKIVIPFAPATTQTFIPGQVISYKSAVEIEILPETDIQQGAELTFEVGNIGSTPASMKLNWLFSRLFNENGTIIGQSKKYFSNNGKILQTQTSNLTAQKVMVNQVIYDGLGRPVINTLAAPKNENDFNYVTGFVTNSQDQEYSYADFDATANLNNPGALGSNAGGTLGWYYSNNNSLDARVPATSYPYSRTDYYNDGTGAAKRNAQVGEAFRMGQGHETRSYTYRTGNELDNYLQIRNKFFSESVVGASPLTIKNNLITTIASDENHNEGLVVKDDKGNIMMSALSGNDILINESLVASGGIYDYFRAAGSGQPVSSIVVTTTGGPTNIKVYETSTDNNTSTLVYSGISTGFPTSWTTSLGVYIVSGNMFTIAYTMQNNSCTFCRAQFVPTDCNYRYFKLMASATVTMNNTSWTLYDMGNNEQVMTFTSGNVLPAGYYKLVTSSVSSPVTITYQHGLSNISYNFYNQLGQLVGSIAPEGVKKLLNGGIANYSTFAEVPFSNIIQYNRKGLVVSTTNVEDGKTECVYRQDGKLRFSQNAKQRATTGSPYNYINYDSWGRPFESGEFLPGTGIAFNVAGMSNVEDVSSTGGLGAGTKNFYKLTYYDYGKNTGLANYTQDNVYLAGAVSYTETSSGAKTWYNYDGRGNVVWLLEDLPGIGKKTINYTYSLIGKTTKIVYQRDVPAETFVHYYEYDADQKVAAVYTNTTDNISTRLLQAKYSYYLHGPLKRTELGGDVQGIDYTYTAQGRIKAINNANRDMDPSQDGISGANLNFAKDVFGANMEYYTGDYLRTGSNIGSVALSGTVASDQYSGELKAIGWHSRKPAAVLSVEGSAIENPTMYGLSYDQNERMVAATWGTPNYTAATFTASSAYSEKNLTYDEQGNIKTLARTNAGGTVSDNFTYNYIANSNKLQTVVNGATNYATYNYDEIGRMASQIPATGAARYLKYDPTGKVTGVYSDAAQTQPVITFVYNEQGVRIQKKDWVGNTTTYYVPDLSGNPMSVYTQQGAGTVVQTELPVYGTNRIGIFDKSAVIYNYELVDHLGNVRAIIDRTKQIKWYSDYYPFGYELRTGGSSYRYGYQGLASEKDKETGWNSFDLRMYDSRIGRWLTVDPASQYYSPYLAMGNDPMNRIDNNGGTDEDLGGPGPGDFDLWWLTGIWIKQVEVTAVAIKRPPPPPDDDERWPIEYRENATRDYYFSGWQAFQDGAGAYSKTFAFINYGVAPLVEFTAGFGFTGMAESMVVRGLTSEVVWNNHWVEGVSRSSGEYAMEMVKAGGADINATIKAMGKTNGIIGKFLGWETGYNSKTVADFTRASLEAEGFTKESIDKLMRAYLQVTQYSANNTSAYPRFLGLRSLLTLFQ